MRDDNFIMSMFLFLSVNAIVIDSKHTCVNE